MQKLLSIDIKSDFGFFRKPDMNSSINLSYNMLHKPALLGILGAIIGMEGYSDFGKTPQYYKELKELKLGIEPLQHEKGNFQKTVIKYSNTVGYANMGTNYLTEESTLIAPAYRCYILLNLENSVERKLYDYLKEGKAEYLPYFGKNEFYAWWDSDFSFKSYDFDCLVKPGNDFRIKSLFIKKDTSIQSQKADNIFDFLNFENEEATFMYFERLPVGFGEDPIQYIFESFAFTTFKLKSKAEIDNLYFLTSENYYVQLF